VRSSGGLRGSERLERLATRATSPMGVSPRPLPRPVRRLLVPARPAVRAPRGGQRRGQAAGAAAAERDGFDEDGPFVGPPSTMLMPAGKRRKPTDPVILGVPGDLVRAGDRINATVTKASAAEVAAAPARLHMPPSPRSLRVMPRDSRVSTLYLVSDITSTPLLSLPDRRDTVRPPRWGRRPLSPLPRLWVPTRPLSPMPRPAVGGRRGAWGAPPCPDALLLPQRWVRGGSGDLGRVSGTAGRGRWGGGRGRGDGPSPRYAAPFPSPAPAISPAPRFFRPGLSHRGRRKRSRLWRRRRRRRKTGRSGLGRRRVVGPRHVSRCSLCCPRGSTGDELCRHSGRFRRSPPAGRGWSRSLQGKRSNASAPDNPCAPPEGLGRILP